MEKEIFIDLSELYSLNVPKESALKLLIEILKFYQLEKQIVKLVSESPDDIEQINFSFSTKETKQEKKMILIKLFDGYEFVTATLLI